MTGGKVAIWHDIAPEGLAEFYAWHGEEHMPERVSIPGFLRGRRFIAINADLAFFNLYDTTSPEVVLGLDYKTRLDSPTPRTLSTVRHFRNVARSLCRLAATASAAERQIAQGGTIATLRLDVSEADEARLVTTISGILPGLAAEPGVASAQLLVADRTASGYANAEQRARGAPNLVPPIVVLAEGWADENAFMMTIRRRLGTEALAHLGLPTLAQLGFYRHQLTVTRQEHQ